MTKLHELAAVLRSKNAGPFLITLDLLFDNETDLARVLKSSVLSSEYLAEHLGVPASDIEVIPYEVARAIKIVLPRLYSSGSPHDTDVYGAQQHAGLLDLHIPQERPRSFKA